MVVQGGDEGGSLWVFTCVGGDHAFTSLLESGTVRGWGGVQNMTRSN